MVGQDDFRCCGSRLHTLGSREYAAPLTRCQYELYRLDLPGVKDGCDVRVWFRIAANLLMNTDHAKAVVPPEPHSTGPDFRKAWDYLPRWLQVVLSLAIIVVGILAAIFLK
jgi:hypothetical protein